MILLLDTTGTGHGTSFPASVDTNSVLVALNDIPDHLVVNSGPCSDDTQVITAPINV